jgi:hypothetical protein
VHEKLRSSFCDKLVTSETENTCPICNVTLYSLHCAEGHKKLCYGKGYFGWKCLNCKKFSYRTGSLVSAKIAKTHDCSLIKCKFCFQCHKKDDFHLCELKKEAHPKSWPKLAFVNFEFQNTAATCWNCYLLKYSFKIQNKLSWKELFECPNFPELNCDIHDQKTYLSKADPSLIIVYKESQERGHFLKSFFSVCSSKSNCESFEYRYCESTEINQNQESRKRKATENFQQKQDDNELSTSPIKKFVQEILNEEWRNTTIVAQYLDGLIFVSYILSFILNSSFSSKNLIEKRIFGSLF